MLFQTTAAHEELRAKIRSFAEEEIKPLAFLMDQNNEFPEEAVKKLGKLISFFVFLQNHLDIIGAYIFRIQ